MSTRLQAALPRRHHVDPEAYAAEHELLLRRSWSRPGRVDELGLAAPGTGRLIPHCAAAVGVLAESDLVAVTRAGELRAHYNVCRHRGAQLLSHDPSEPPVGRTGRVWRCPYHSWTYDLGGRLVHAPHIGDVDLDPAAFGLHPVGVGAWGGFLWLNPDGTGESLAEAIGPPGRGDSRPAVGGGGPGDAGQAWGVRRRTGAGQRLSDRLEAVPVHPHSGSGFRPGAGSGRATGGRQPRGGARFQVRSHVRLSVTAMWRAPRRAELRRTPGPTP